MGAIIEGDAFSCSVEVAAEERPEDSASYDKRSRSGLNRVGGLLSIVRRRPECLESHLPAKGSDPNWHAKHALRCQLSSDARAARAKESKQARLSLYFSSQLLRESSKQQRLGHFQEEMVAGKHPNREGSCGLIAPCFEIVMVDSLVAQTAKSGNRATQWRP